MSLNPHPLKARVRHPADTAIAGDGVDGGLYQCGVKIVGKLGGFGYNWGLVWMCWPRLSGSAGNNEHESGDCEIT